jgi:hypothetical protein
MGAQEHESTEAAPVRVPPILWRNQDNTGHPDTTSFPELVAHIVTPGGPRARRSLDAWLCRRANGPSHKRVHEFVTNHRHTVLGGLTVADVELATVWRSPDNQGALPDPRHALGVMKASTDNIVAIDDWKAPPWAFTFIFHDLMERLGRVPTWPDVEDFVRHDGKANLLEPFAHWCKLSEMDHSDKRRWCTGLRWRLGVAYYSFVREVDTIVRLRRTHDMPIRYHVLADTQFKIDFWCGNVLVALLIRNPKYRDDRMGRKARTADMMDVSSFKTLACELLVPSAYGRPALLSSVQIKDLAAQITRAMDAPVDAA